MDTALQEADGPQEFTVYRGTNHWNEGVDPSTKPRGTFFTDDSGRASRYGTVSKHQVSFQKPYVTDFNGNLWDSGDGDFNSIDDIADYAKENGYDGVIAKNVRGGSDDNFTSTEYVVFGKDQISLRKPGSPDMMDLANTDRQPTQWARDPLTQAGRDDTQYLPWGKDSAKTFTKEEVPGLMSELTGKHKAVAGTRVNILGKGEFGYQYGLLSPEYRPPGAPPPDGAFFNPDTKQIYILDGANTRGVLFHELGHAVDMELNGGVHGDPLMERWTIKGNRATNVKGAPRIPSELSLTSGERGVPSQEFAGIVRKAYTGSEAEKKAARAFLKKIGMMSLLPIINFGKSAVRSIKSLND